MSVQPSASHLGGFADAAASADAAEELIPCASRVAKFTAEVDVTPGRDPGAGMACVREAERVVAVDVIG
jgi:hypothetical protein